MAVGEASGISLWKVTRHEIPLLNSTSLVKGQQVCKKLLVSWELSGDFTIPLTLSPGQEKFRSCWFVWILKLCKKPTTTDHERILIFKTGDGKNQDQKESPPVKNTSTLILIAEFSYERERPQPHGFLDTRIPKQCLPKSQAEDGITSWGRGVSTDAWWWSPYYSSQQLLKERIATTFTSFPYHQRWSHEASYLSISWCQYPQCIMFYDLLSQIFKDL
jgi:hypothetical protein